MTEQYTLLLRYQSGDEADAEVGCGGDDDADAHEFEGLLSNFQGEMMREQHGADGDEEIGQHVVHGSQPAVAYQAIDETVPDGCPGDYNDDVGHDHYAYATAEVMNGKEGGENDASLNDDIPHIDITLAATDNHVVIERSDGQKGSCHTWQLHERCRGQPLLGNSDDDEFLCYECKS